MTDPKRAILRSIELCEPIGSYDDLTIPNLSVAIETMYDLLEAFRDYSKLRGDQDIADAIDQLM